MSQIDELDVDKILSVPIQPIKFNFSKKDSILYCLGIGFNQDPLKEDDYKYTLQFREGFSVFPTYGTILTISSVFKLIQDNPYVPHFNPYNLLHAEEKISMVHSQIYTNQDYLTEAKMVNIYGKATNAFFQYKFHSFLIKNGKKDLAFEVDATFYIKGIGAIKNKKDEKINKKIILSKSKCDSILQAKTFPQQAFIYRLNQDYNPLHVDPKASTVLKFDRPILHGLATFSVIAKEIVQNLLGNDCQKLKKFSAKFVGHVYPGESLRIQIWSIQKGFDFEAYTKERNTKCIIGQFVVRQTAKL